MTLAALGDRAAWPCQSGAPRLPDRAGSRSADARWRSSTSTRRRQPIAGSTHPAKGSPRSTTSLAPRWSISSSAPPRRRWPGHRTGTALLETVMYLQTQDGRVPQLPEGSSRDDQRRTDRRATRTGAGGPLAASVLSPAATPPSGRSTRRSRPAARSVRARAKRALDRALTQDAGTDSSLHGVRQPAGPAQGRDRHQQPGAAGAHRVVPSSSRMTRPGGSPSGSARPLPNPGPVMA